MIDHFTVGHRKKARGHLDNRRLHPEPPEGGGILEAIHAAAQDDERSGQVIEFVKGFVGEIVDAGKPRDLRDEGGCARGDDELPGGKGLAACLDAVRVDEGRLGRYHADADPLEGLREVLFVGRPDDAPYVGHDPGAVQAAIGQGQEAEALQVRHVAACVAEPDQGLARDAGQVGAVSADPRFLDDGHALAQAVGRHGGNHPGDAGADDDQVVVVIPLHGPLAFPHVQTDY